MSDSRDQAGELRGEAMKGWRKGEGDGKGVGGKERGRMRPTRSYTSGEPALVWALHARAVVQPVLSRAASVAGLVSRRVVGAALAREVSSRGAVY
jgi:hypothetical protein